MNSPNVTSAGGTVTLDAADATNDRIDLIQVDLTTGAVSKVTGTPAATPVAPDPDTGNVAIAQATVVANATSVAQSDVLDVANRGATDPFRGH